MFGTGVEPYEGVGVLAFGRFAVALNRLSSIPGASAPLGSAAAAFATGATDACGIVGVLGFGLFDVALRSPSSTPGANASGVVGRASAVRLVTLALIAFNGSGASCCVLNTSCRSNRAFSLPCTPVSYGFAAASVLVDAVRFSISLLSEVRSF